MNYPKIKNKEKIIIPRDISETWQTLLNLLAFKLKVPAALVMKIDLPNIKVFLASESEDNPYRVGDSECLLGSGFYCERVFKTKGMLLIPNALKDKEWNKNPDIKLGMISYMGVPIVWPDGEIFGTICALDMKENPYTEEYKNTLVCFKEYIEGYLNLAVYRYLEKDAKKIAAEDAHCDMLFCRIERALEKESNGNKT